MHAGTLRDTLLPDDTTHIIKTPYEHKSRPALGTPQGPDAPGRQARCLVQTRPRTDRRTLGRRTSRSPTRDGPANASREPRRCLSGWKTEARVGRQTQPGQCGVRGLLAPRAKRYYVPRVRLRGPGCGDRQRCLCRPALGRWVRTPDDECGQAVSASIWMLGNGQGCGEAWILSRTGDRTYWLDWLQGSTPCVQDATVR